MVDDGPQVVLITGASSGIGKETAQRYARQGVRLVLGARSSDTLQAVAKECLANGAGDVLVRPTDIGDAEQVNALFEAATTDFGRVDVVIQSAAVTAFGRFEDIPADVFDAIVRTNLLGAANVARTALAHFREHRGGQLVLVGSLLGITAVPLQSAYVASKFALHGLARSLRQENRHLPGIRVHVIVPGPVNTPVYGTAGNYYGRVPRVPPAAVAPSQIVEAIMRATSMRRSSEQQVGWFNRPVIAAFRRFPRAFDAVILPLLRVMAFTSERTQPSEGNAASN